MGDKKRSVMNKWKRTLIAAALTASVILALPVWNVGSAEAVDASEKLDLTERCILTINRTVENAKFQGDVVVDLYRVAKADDTQTKGYEAYKLTAIDPYTGIQSTLDTAMNMTKDVSGNWITDPTVSGVNESYRKLAQDVAEIALGFSTQETGEGEGEVSTPIPLQKTASIELPKGATEGKAENLEAGMYLVVAHGKGLTVDQYVERMTAEVEKEDAPQYGSKEGTQIVTKAYYNGYVYTYLPELISLPARVDANGTVVSGSFNTADTTHRWATTLTATLKSEQSRELAALRITKTFQDVSGNNLTGNELVKQDGFTFRYEVRMDGEFLFSDVETIYYDAKGEFGTGQYTCETEKKIPVGEGVTVTVTEVNSGAAFTPDSAGGKIALWNMADGVYEISFVNTYTGNLTGGNVINNRFTYSVDEGWDANKESLKPLVPPKQTEPET